MSEDDCPCDLCIARRASDNEHTWTIADAFATLTAERDSALAVLRDWVNAWWAEGRGCDMVRHKAALDRARALLAKAGGEKEKHGDV